MNRNEKEDLTEMVLRKRIITLDGDKITIEEYDTTMVLGNGKEMERIEELLREDEIEEKIQKALSQIENYAKKYPQKEKNLRYCFEVGKILQFIDEGKYIEDRHRIWQRMAYDLRPELFGGKKEKRKEATRIPEFMYFLGKQIKSDIKRVNWDQWYEIHKFKDLWTDKRLLELVLRECEEKQIGSKVLRNRIKELMANNKAQK